MCTLYICLHSVIYFIFFLNFVTEHFFKQNQFFKIYFWKHPCFFLSHYAVATFL